MLSVCSDQGGRKKTKIVHLPAENATEIAEEMTARFRKLQSKTNKQAAIERKKKAKAKKAQQLEADKKGQAHDDIAARFKADLQVHEAVGDRRTGRMGAFYAWHNTTLHDAFEKTHTYVCFAAVLLTSHPASG